METEFLMDDVCGIADKIAQRYAHLSAIISLEAEAEKARLDIKKKSIELKYILKRIKELREDS